MSQRTVQAIAISNVISRNPVLGSQLAHIAEVFEQAVSAENNGCYSEAIANVDVLIARLTAHRTSLVNASKPNNLTESAESFGSAIIAQGARVVAQPLQQTTTTALEQLRQRIEIRDNVMDDDTQPNGSRPPTGDDYNELHQDVIATLEALGFRNR